MMQYKGHYGSIEYSDEDNVFFGKIQFIRSLISYEGRDIQALHQAFVEAVDDYLAHCEQENTPVEQPFLGRFQVRTASDLHRRTALLAHRKGTDISQVVTEALEAYLRAGSAH